MTTAIDNIIQNFPQNCIYKSKLYNSDVDIKNWIYKRFKNSNEDFMKEYKYKTHNGIEKFAKINIIFNKLNQIVEMFKNDVIYVISQICKEFIPYIPQETIKFILQKHDFDLKLENIKSSAKKRFIKGENIGNFHKDINIDDIYFECCFALYDIIKSI